MIVVLLGALLAAAVVWGAVVRPLLRATPDGAGEGDAVRVSVYAEQLAALERDLASGAIDRADAAALRAEIGRRALAAAGQVSGESLVSRPIPGWAAWGLGAVAALGAVGGYAALGQPGLPDHPLVHRQVAASSPADAAAAETRASAQGRHPELDALVAGLESRLAADPEDAAGWVLLGRSRFRLGDPEGAVAAFRTALSRGAGDDPRVLGEYAEALVLAADGIVTDEAADLFARLAAVDPANPQPAYYLALAAAQAGDVASAVTAWGALLAAAPPGAPWADMVRRRILEVGGTMAAPSADAATRGPGAADVAAAADLSADDRSAMIEGMVAGLAARLEQEPDDLDGWRRLARAYDVLGRPEAAREAYRSILRLAPDDADARRGLAAIDTATADVSPE